MNISALIIGILIACFIIVKFKKAGYEKHNLAYPLLLSTFPVYYWFFSVYSSDYGALFNEIIVGMIFIVLALIALKLSKNKGLLILAIGFISHGLYDVVHANIYNHSVAPLWWPEFCGSIDILLGVYMLYLFKVVVHQKTQ
jgi:hypothetical protein